jgi:hypothetical protein
MPEGEPAEPAPPPERERQIVGYAVGALSVVLATIGVVAMIASFGGDSDDDTLRPAATGDVVAREAPELLPDGGLFDVPEEVDDVEQGAEAADCELRSFRVKSKDHVPDPDEEVRYSSSPPTSGRHHPVPAEDGAYSVSPDVRKLVHTLEHSRVIVWFDRDLPRRARASLKAFYDSDSQLMVLVPDTTGMEYEVAATAWNRKPGRNGTGRLLGCREYSDDVYTALEAFKKAHRGRGPELVP